MRVKKFQAGGFVSGILLPMGLICLFAFCTLALALLGGGAYRAIQNNVSGEYTNVIAANYLRTKISQSNTEGAVELRDENGVEVLVVHSGEAMEYETRIFVYDGALKESYVLADREFDPAVGSVLTAVEDCSFVIYEDGLFQAVILSDNGDETRVAMALMGGGAT